MMAFASLDEDQCFPSSPMVQSVKNRPVYMYTKHSKPTAHVHVYMHNGNNIYWVELCQI